MSATGIKSKPVYSPLRADTRGRYHWLLGFGAGAPALERVLRELRDAAPGETRVLFVPDANATADRFESSGLAALHTFEDADGLLTECRALLGRSLMGTRVYIAGPEHFIGRVLRLTLEFDMNKDEVYAEEAGSLSRRLWCVHCRATTDNVRTNIAECSGCGRWLFVRDHYSRRLAAYMGVMVDAEVPGDLPPIHEAYP